MKQKIALYLAGSIKKEHEKEENYFWSLSEIETLKENLDSYEISFLNPAFRSDNLSDQRSVFGRDMLQVYCSDIVLVDARERRGLGVGAEMMWAKLHKKPIIAWAPKNTHYHKSKTVVLGTSVNNWVHPFVESLSDRIVENLNEAAHWIDKFIMDSSLKIKGLEDIEEAMSYYEKTQFHLDLPMKELLFSNPSIANRINNKICQSLNV